MKYQFDHFVLDTRLPSLMADNSPLPLSPRELALLVLLVQSRQQTLDHQSLLAQLWPDRVVTAQSIARLVADTRRALKRAGVKGPVIETCHGQGYRLAPALVNRLTEVPQETPLPLPARRSRLGMLLVALLLPLLGLGAYWLLKPAPLQFSESPYVAGRILWVDDHPENNQSEVEQLRAQGYGVHQVTDTEDAMTLLAIYQFDLVISDMGRANNPLAGFDLLAALRAQNRQLPVLFYTLVVNPPLLAEVARLGGQGAAETPDALYDLVRGQLHRPATSVQKSK